MHPSFRRSGIPSIAEAAHGDERPPGTSWGATSADSGACASAKGMATSTADASGSTAVGAGSAGDALMGAAAGGEGGDVSGDSPLTRLSSSFRQQRQQQHQDQLQELPLAPAASGRPSQRVVQRRSSTGDAGLRDSTSPLPGGDGRKSKKPRGPAGAAGESSRRASGSSIGGGGVSGGGGVGADGGRGGGRSRSHSPTGNEQEGAATAEGGRIVRPSSPPYAGHTLGDLLRASSATERREDDHHHHHHHHHVAATPPPPDPSASWGREREESGSRRVHMGNRRSGRFDSASGSVAGAAEPTPAGTVDGAEGGGGGSSAPAGRVVTVDVYRPPAGPPRGRDTGRRGEGSRRGDRGRGGERSPPPLVAIMMSSPSVSPTPSLSPTPQPGGSFYPTGEEGFETPANTGHGFESGSGFFAWDTSGMEKTGESEGDGGVSDGAAGSGSGGGGVSGGDSSGSKSAAAAPAQRPPVASNSLMLSTDSLGNVRIYAKTGLLDLLQSSAFSASQ